MKTLKKKFSVYQSSQKVRKLWGDYSEARGAIANSRSHEDFDHEPSTEHGEAHDGSTVTNSGAHIVSSTAAGRGSGRALRAFVEAVDLGDAKQAAVLQNLDEGGQGELVATLLELAKKLVGADTSKEAFSPTVGDILLAEKALRVVQTCLAGRTGPRHSNEWKKHLKMLVSVLAQHEGARDGQVSVVLDTDMSAKMVDVKSAVLRVLRVVVTDRNRVIELGQCEGFQTIARLIVPQRSPLRCQATEVLGHLLAMSSVDHEATRYPTTPGARERSDRSGRARRSTDRGLADDIIRAAGEDEDLESSVTESASSSSSLADAASFVYSSFQALVSSGRDAGRLPAPTSLGVAVAGGRGLPVGHLPMAAVPQSLVGESVRVEGLAPDRIVATGEVGVGAGGPDAKAVTSKNIGLVKEQAEVGGRGDVAQTMLEEGVLVVLADVIAPEPAPPRVEGGEACASWIGPDRSPDEDAVETARLDALEASVLMLEGRPQAQAEFVRLDGYARIRHLINDLAMKHETESTPSASAEDASTDHGRSRSDSRSASLPRSGRASHREGLQGLHVAFDTLFRLALGGQAIAAGARADGTDAVKMLLVLATASPSLTVTLRAARSLQALLHVRPLNAVVLERFNAMRVLTAAVANLAFSDQAQKYVAAVEYEGKGAGAGVVEGERAPERAMWSVDDKREALSSLNDVVRTMAAVYSRQDSFAVEGYASILLTMSSARFGGNTVATSGTHCSKCEIALSRTGCKGRLLRCLAKGCDGTVGLCGVCDATLHSKMDDDSHVRVPMFPTKYEAFKHPPTPVHGRSDPEWAVEAGNALMKAMAIMLDDRESFGLAPAAVKVSVAGDCGASGAGDDARTPSPTGVLAVMLRIAQDELLEPLRSSSQEDLQRRSLVEGDTARDDRIPSEERAKSAKDWTEGWLLGALEIVARVVVRGGTDTVDELGAAGGWGLLAHITRLPSPPRHISVGRPWSNSAKTRAGGTSRGMQEQSKSHESGGDRLSSTWLGWVGARRLSLWILREALLTGTGQCRDYGAGILALAQPAGWLVWLVRKMMHPGRQDGHDDGDCDEHRACNQRSATGQTLMKLALLNELRLAIGSFAPCEVVMEGCTRVLPLVALQARDEEISTARAHEGDMASQEAECSVGVSPNRHPQAHAGAPNIKVVGRLSGDQRGIVRDALVSEGLMEALLAVIQEIALLPSSSSKASATSESGVAMLCLADFAAGSERAKARLGSTLGYDTLSKAAHGAGVTLHEDHFSLWLEASVRRPDGVHPRLAPPFAGLTINTGRVIAAAKTNAEGASSRILSTAGSGSNAKADRANGEVSGRRPRRGEAKGAKSLGWGKRGSESAHSAEGSSFKEGIAWVPRTLPKLPRSLARGTAEPQLNKRYRRNDTDTDGASSRGEHEACGVFDGNRMSDELWLPPGLLTLAQDVLLINRARGGVVVRGKERYFLAQARAVRNVTASESRHVQWQPMGAKFRGLEAAVFPFLLLPLVPLEQQPHAAGQVSHLLDANPANAAALCHLRVPLALLKLACLLPEKSQVRDLYFRLAAQLMSHHISPADAMELFHLASLQPSAWARLGRFRVTSAAELSGSVESSRQRHAKQRATNGDGEGDQVRVRVRNGDQDKTVAMPPHSDELQMQLLYVIGTVVDSPSPAWFFHMDGSAGSGLGAGPIVRFPPQRVGYSVSMWLRPSGFSGGSSNETSLLTMSVRNDDGSVRSWLRITLRRCPRPGDSSAFPAAAGIGASEDDDHGRALERASAFLHVRVNLVDASDPTNSTAVDTGTSFASGSVSEQEVQCGQWQHVVVSQANSPNVASSTDGRWIDGSLTIYLDGERRMIVTDRGEKDKRDQSGYRRSLAYPACSGAGGGVWASVGCWEEDGGAGLTSTPTADTGFAEPSAARFNGQIATVALTEGAWTADTAKATFLRGPGAPPPGKRITFTTPGDLPPTPFLDPNNDVETHRHEVEAWKAEGANARDGGLKELQKFEQGDGDSMVAAAADIEGNPGSLPCLATVGVFCSPPVQPCTQGGVQDGVTAYGVPSSNPREVALGLGSSSPAAGAPPHPMGAQHSSLAAPRLSVLLAPARKAIDLKYGVAVSDYSTARLSGTSGRANAERSGRGPTDSKGKADADASAGGEGRSSSALSESVSLTVNSLAVAAGCGGSKDSCVDNRDAFRLLGRGTCVYATTPLHAAVQAAGGFRLCLPFLKMDHARQVAALRVLAGLLEASAEGMDAFRVRDGFNVLYHALAQGDDALQQLSMDTFDTLFELMTSEALQEAVEVPAAGLYPVTLLDAIGKTADPDEPSDVRPYLAKGCAGLKPVRSPEALRLVVDLLGHCEREPEVQARAVEALVDALDGSPAGIKVWRRAFEESGVFSPLLYLMSPPSWSFAEELSSRMVDIPASASNGGIGIRSRSSRRSASSSIPSAPPGSAAMVSEEGTLRKVSKGARPAVAAGSAARTQATRMIQVLIAGSAAMAPAVRPQDSTAAVATSTSAGCTPEHLAALVGFVLRCHLEVEQLSAISRRQMLNTGQEERLGAAAERRSVPSGSVQSQLVLTRRVGGTVLDLLVQLCGGDGGAVLVGMMAQAFPAGGNFLVALELLSSSHVDTRVSAIKLLSLMLVRKGESSRRTSSATFFSSDVHTNGAGSPTEPDPQALRAFEKIGGFAAMCRQLEQHTTCQAVCDALMGMIFGVWGSKHEPRAIREKDVLAIKGNKESWLRSWWSSYSSPPEDDSTNPNTMGQASSGEGPSLVDRIRATASGVTAPATAAPNSADGDADSAAAAIPAEEDKIPEDTHGSDKSCPHGTVAYSSEQASEDASQSETQSTEHEGAGRTSTGLVKTGRFAALINRAVETSQNGGIPVKLESSKLVAAQKQFITGGSTERSGDKEETSFLSGFFRRLSIEHGSSGADAAAEASTVPKTMMPYPTGDDAVADVQHVLVPTASQSVLNRLSVDDGFDPLLAESAPPVPNPGRCEVEDKRDTNEEKGSDGTTNAAGVDGGGSGGGNEPHKLVLPEAVEVLMRALHRAQSPAVLARPLLQLESAVAWVPPTPGHDTQGQGRGSRRDFNGPNVGVEAGGGAIGRAGGKFGARITAGMPGGRGKGNDDGNREENADALMARQGWLSWCHRLVESLSVRNDNGDLLPGRMNAATGGNGLGHSYSGIEGELAGSDRWGATGSEASEAGGYLDDSYSETTDTGSAFSYFESSSVGRSVAPDGGSSALEAFTGPIYGLVAALLEQDMARAPRDKRGHRFLELFSLSDSHSFQAAVLEDTLDGVQDSPMLSTENSPTLPHAGGSWGTSGDERGSGSVRRLESLRDLLATALYRRPDLPLALCVKGVHTINLLGYHSSHEARSRMKSVGLLSVRNDLIRRCLFHPRAASWEQVSAISQVEDALETLVSQPGKAGGEAEVTAAGEVAVQLLHLFVEVSTAAVAQTAGPGASSNGALSPILKNTPAASAALATQVAAARVLGRVVVASAYCRTAVIAVARDRQLLVRLLPALRCHLTIEEVEAIELGNIPDSLPSLSASSRWSIGSISLLPNSAGPTSCISDDAEHEDENVAIQSPQRNRSFFPPTPSPHAAGAGSWSSTAPGPSASFVVAASVQSGSGAGDPSAVTSSAGGALGGGTSTQYRLDEVVEEEDEEGGSQSDAESTAHQTAGGGRQGSEAKGLKSPAARKRTRRRSSSDIIPDSPDKYGVVGSAVESANGVSAKSQPTTGSWHGPNGSGTAGVATAVGGWGVPEHHDLQAFVRWYSGEERHGMRAALRRRVSKALAPLAKTRSKTASKHASKREKAMRQAQKREFEFTAAKDKAANDAVERCRAHAERAADRTCTDVDAWLSERRRRWEAGRTRCEELAPPAGGAWVAGMQVDAIDSCSSSESAAGTGVPADSIGSNAACFSREVRAGESKREVSWDWGTGKDEGGSFEAFFDTFAGGHKESDVASADSGATW